MSSTVALSDFYPGRKLHVFDNEYDKRMLEGFTTDLPQILSHFRHEVDMCKGAVDKNWQERYPESFTEHMMAIFERHGMRDELEDRLTTLMQSQELTFY